MTLILFDGEAVALLGSRLARAQQCAPSAKVARAVEFAARVSCVRSPQLPRRVLRPDVHSPLAGTCVQHIHHILRVYILIF